MTNSPKVSIVMPVFNGGLYFELALQSALAQTYQNLEIVIVNDGSTDGGETAAIAAKYVAQHPHIKYIFQENRGVGAALNTALSEMAGDIFTWLSHDDLFEPHKTERQVHFFNRLNKPDAMVFSDWYSIGPRGELLNEINYNHRELVQKPRLALLGGMINGVTLFIPKHILVEFGGFDERYRFVQDYDLWNKIVAKYDFFHMPEKLIRYRSHPGQDTHKPAAVMESEDLWIRMMDSRHEAERVHLCGSSYMFYKFMASHLEASPFKRAAAYADKRSVEIFGETLVSVIIPVTAADDALECTLASVEGQVGTEIELVIVDTSRKGVSINAGAEGRLRVLRMPGASFGQALQQGALDSVGDYISFARPGAQFALNRFWKQMAEMQLNGREVSYTPYVFRVANPEGGRPAGVVGVSTSPLAAHMGRSAFRLETLMIHRNIVLGGVQLNAWSDDDLLLAVSRRENPLLINEPLSILPSQAT